MSWQDSLSIMVVFAIGFIAIGCLMYFASVNNPES